MNATIAKALILEDWIRVRHWYPWVIGMLIVYTAGLYGLDAYLYRALTTASGLTGLERLQNTNHLPTFYLYLLPFLVVLLSVTMLGMLQHARGVSIAYPTRFMTLPVSTLGAVLVQIATRCILTIPLGYLFLVNVAIAYSGDFYGTAPWIIAPFIGILGCQAINLWWTRMEHTAIALWIGVPLFLWYVPPTLRADLHTLSLVASVALPLLGVVSGAWWIRRSGALEGQDFSPSDLLRSLIPVWRTAEAAPQVIVPFASPGAAVRWAENPGGIWWPLGIALAAGFAFECHETYSRYNEILALPWIPWTPTWVKWCSAAQHFGVGWFGKALVYIIASFMFCLPIQGFGVLRRNLLNRPLAARLPMAPWDFSMQVGATVLRHVLITYFAALLVLYAGYMACGSPNIGMQYFAATTHDNYDAYLNNLLASQNALNNVDPSDLVTYLLHSPSAGWVLFWPMCWLLFLASTFFPTDLILLAGMSAFVLRRVAKRERRLHWWALLVLCGSVVLTFCSLYFLRGSDLDILLGPDQGSTNALWTVGRAGLAALAFLITPVATIWVNIRLRSHL